MPGRAERGRRAAGRCGSFTPPGSRRTIQPRRRRQRVFYAAYGTEDVVKSEWLIRDNAGQEYRPDDYLTAFARFVKENEAGVEAIAILLGRPQRWGTDALMELRQKLSAAREHFTAENLEMAHAARYGRGSPC